MDVLEVARRPDRHRALLDTAEPLFPRALLYFERGRADDIRHANALAEAIAPDANGDIGWQAVDVAIILTRHADRLTPATRAHLADLLAQALPAWATREFGRGNVNHPTIATWLLAAAGVALGRADCTRLADDRLQRFIHIFSEAGDMSEYNSPTYLGPTLVGLANIGTYAATPLTRLRARLIEERIWLGIAARWHGPTQQVAGPFSRAYADGTLGFGGVIRYLLHAVLDAPVFWDDDLLRAYDHDHDAEWATKIAASTFSVPDTVRALAAHKPLPYAVRSDTHGEDYTIDGREVYRGGWGRLATHLAPAWCLGTAERPYVDGGQSEGCIAFWARRTPVRRAHDVGALYFRYIANDRLPGQPNTYPRWYGGREMTYSANLLHQDGRLHTLQHGGKAIVLAQPLRRENGLVRSLRFDALLSLHDRLPDEVWLGERQIDVLPASADTDAPVLIRDGDVYLMLRPLHPTDLGNATPALHIAQVNGHLIVSIYNLRGDGPREFPAHRLDNTHNGMAVELADDAAYGDFAAFRRHAAAVTVAETLRLGEERRVRYRSGPDELAMHYHPATQEITAATVNGEPVARQGFHCPHLAHDASGRLHAGDASLTTAADTVAWLAHEPTTGWVVATLPTDAIAPLRLAHPLGCVEADAFGLGRVAFRPGAAAELDVDADDLRAPLRLAGMERVARVTVNGEDAAHRLQRRGGAWELR